MIVSLLICNKNFNIEALVTTSALIVDVYTIRCDPLQNLPTTITAQSPKQKWFYPRPDAVASSNIDDWMRNHFILRGKYSNCQSTLPIHLPTSTLPGKAWIPRCNKEIHYDLGAHSPSSERFTQAYRFMYKKCNKNQFFRINKLSSAQIA